MTWLALALASWLGLGLCALAACVAAGHADDQGPHAAVLRRPGIGRGRRAA